MRAVVVWGPPCSGKTTYARDQMGERDLLYDYDAMKRAMTTESGRTVARNVSHRYAVEFRTMFADLLKTETDAETAYILATRPTDRLRDLLSGLDVEYHRMEADKTTCLERLAADDERPDKDEWTRVIEEWFTDQAAIDAANQRGGEQIMYKRTAIPMASDFQTRETEDGKRRIEGYFAVFGSTYPLWDGAVETIDPGAFRLDRDTDVRALVNHDTTLVMGRTTAGTLELRVDDRGLWGAIEINEEDQDAVNQWARVQRRDVTQCSFGFDILDQYMETRADGTVVWHLRDVRLYEVSVVTFPAYEATGVQARRAEWETIQNRKNETWRAAMLARLKGE